MNISDLLTKILEFSIVIGTGALGGIARVLVHHPKDEPYNLWIAAREIAIAAITGIVVNWILTEYNFSENFRSAAVAVTGFSAREVLTLLRTLLLDKLKKIGVPPHDSEK